MNTFVDYLESLAQSKHEWLWSKTSSLLWLDYPDHHNVGDVAIWLGAYRFSLTSGIASTGIYSARMVNSSISNIPKERRETAFINGGGNFGGLWEMHHQNRLAVLQSYKGRVVLQGPQTVEFDSDDKRLELGIAASRLKELRMLVRDDRSLGLVRDFANVRLSPDSAHLLGSLSVSAPTRPVVVVARSDKESADVSSTLSSEIRQDWSYDSVLRRSSRRIASESRKLNGRVFDRAWQDVLVRRAERRLARGLSLLSSGDVIVTNRLHAMILGLQCGRRVVAVDNNYGKLSRYAHQWLDGYGHQLVFAASLDQALDYAVRSTRA